MSCCSCIVSLIRLWRGEVCHIYGLLGDSSQHRWAYRHIVCLRDVDIVHHLERKPRLCLYSTSCTSPLNNLNQKKRKAYNNKKIHLLTAALKPAMGPNLGLILNFGFGADFCAASSCFPMLELCFREIITFVLDCVDSGPLPP